MANGLADTAKDPIIEQVIQGVEAKLDPQMKTEYQRIVVAGMHFMFDPGTHKYMLQAIQKGQQDAHLTQHLVQGILKLIGLIARESKGQMNKVAVFPAAITLLCKAAEFVEAQTGAKITKDNLAAMVHSLLVALMKLYKIDQSKLAQGIDYARANQGKAAPSPEAATPEQPTEPAVTPEEPAPEEGV